MAWYFIGVNNIENYIILKEIQNLSSDVDNSFPNFRCPHS